ncbi:DinB family protein [Kallotenue papyrolyticum]|uniref:DinB family protein n=1 Tax=Kallotenue papyrolyticum TaxID=1325125 RepID=UPI0004785DDB|nr:DinB family protein [Kallotenue papyrolyticum]
MFEIERVRASWQRESAAIDALIDALDEQAATTPIRDDGWTTQDLLGHIASAARGFLRAVQGQAVPVVDVDAFNEQQRQRGRQRPWSATRDYWRQVRDEVAAYLAQADDSIGDQAAQLAWLPQVRSVGEALRAMIIHTRTHRQELEQGLAQAGQL